MGVDSISSVTASAAVRMQGQAAPAQATTTEKAAPLPRKPESDQETRNGVAAESRLDAFVETVNSKLSRVNRRIDIYIVEGSHELAARVVDTESNEVVKYIPPKELLELRSRIDKMVGFLFDKGA